MSLVAYASSDGSENEEEEIKDVSQYNDSILPSKKQRETVKITIPSLKEFQDNNETNEDTKKPKPKKGSGLFSILPPPKHSLTNEASLVPHTLTKKKFTPVSKSSKRSSAGTIDESAPAASNSQSGVNYFSLDSFDSPSESKDHSSVGYQSDSFLFSALPKPCASYADSTQTFPLEEEVSPSIKYEASTDFAYENDIDSSSEISNHNCLNQNLLQSKEFQKIKGRHAKEEINIIDISAADQLAGSEELMMQSLTEEKVHRPSKRRYEMPTQQQKRKHQITYLAFQAKEREQDLKNQWSQNSRTRRETQAKYGF